MPGRVIAVSASPRHAFSKTAAASVVLLEGLGIQGDAHCGATVKHRSRVARDPAQPNLRQVHLMHGELFAELAAKGFTVAPGQLGENITTTGIDLLSLPTGTELMIGTEVVLCLTGLRNPCVQLDRFQHGLMSAVLDRAEGGRLIRKAGVMSIVRTGGVVRAGDEIRVNLPTGTHHGLEPV
jgi:MOSC domain-containing protein YiiM